MRARRGLTTLLLLLSCLATARHAWAAAETGPEPEDAYAKRPRLLARFDALGLLGNRYGVQVEYLATEHDAFGAYPFVVLGTTDGQPGLFVGDPDFTYPTRTTAVGLDLQYRRYFSDSGPRGFFLAPGLEAQSFATDTTQECVAGSYQYNNKGAPCPTGFPSVHQSFGYVGPSLDVGWQAALWDRLVLGVSAGVHYRAVLGSLDTSEMPWEWTAMNGPGLRPRLRLEIGWAFL